MIALLLLLTQLTENDRQRLYYSFPNTLEKIQQGQKLAIDDIIYMTRAGCCDDVIIEEIHATKSYFSLTIEDQKTLTHAGVSERVIDEMMRTTHDNN